MKELVIRYTLEFKPGSGVVSQVSWENPNTISALRKMFAVSSDERIIGLEITEYGIKAYFKKD